MSVVILVGGYLIFAEVVTPAKFFSLRDAVSLSSEKSEPAGEIGAESAKAEAAAVPKPPTRAAPGLPGGASFGTESASVGRPEKMRVIANSKSKRYHLPGMKYYDKIPADRRVIFTSEEAARQAGYSKSPK